MLKSRFYEKFPKYLLLIGSVATLGIVIPLVILAYAQNNVGSTDNAYNGDPKYNPPTTQPLCFLPNFLRPSGEEEVTQLITPRQKIYFPLKRCEKLNSVDIYIKGTNQKLPKDIDKSLVVITLKSPLESNKEYEVVIKLNGGEVRGYFKVVPKRPKDFQTKDDWQFEKYQCEQDSSSSCNNQ